ncbi:MAG: hypothetical protein ACYC7E_12720 [Armatimonadota bacterium]
MNLNNRMIRFRTVFEQSEVKPIAKRYLATLLPMLADDTGCFPDSPKEIKRALFLEDEDITTELIRVWLDEFVRDESLVCYTVEGYQFFWIRDFFKTQELSSPRKPTYPLPDWLEWQQTGGKRLIRVLSPKGNGEIVAGREPELTDTDVDAPPDDSYRKRGRKRKHVASASDPDTEGDNQGLSVAIEDALKIRPHDERLLSQIRSCANKALAVGVDESSILFAIRDAEVDKALLADLAEMAIATSLLQ